MTDFTRRPELEGWTDMMRERLRELYARHHDFVWRVCWRYVQNTADADDLAQEVLVKSAQRWKGFSGECAVSSWLYRVAANHCRDHLRKRTAQRDALDRDPFSGCAGEWTFRAAEPAWGGDHEKTAARVLNALRAGLDGPERHIVYLRFDVGMAQHGIVRVTGLPRAAVRRRLARIRERAALLFSGFESGASPSGTRAPRRIRS